MIALLAIVFANPCGDRLESFSWPVDNPAAVTFVCVDTFAGGFSDGFE